MALNRVLKRALRVTAVTTGSLLLLLVAAGVTLNTQWAQNKLMSKATAMLSRQLDTRVSVERVSVAFLTQNARLHGLYLEDRQRRPMLEARLLEADVNLRALLDGEVVINNARLEGVNAHIYQPHPDSAANFSFVIDAFSDSAKKSSTAMKLDLRRVTAEQIDVTYNSDSLSLGRLELKWDSRLPDVTLERVTFRWTRPDRKGQPVDRLIALKRARYEVEGDSGRLAVKGLGFKSDNHLPHKNVGKPHRGFFDAGHLDVTADLDLLVRHVTADTVNATLTRCVATDTVTGIDLRELRCDIAANRRAIKFSDVVVRQGDTRLRIARGDIDLPDKAAGRPISYRTSTVTGRVHLKDISRPFAPVLRGFNLPLTLSTTMRGNDDGMTFANVVVTMPGHSFKVHAAGGVSGLRKHDKRYLKVHFDVIPMTVRAADVETIVKQFPVKRFMMSQLKALDYISFRGDLDVIYNHVLFGGHLLTAVGGVDFNCDVDRHNKYVGGNLSAQNIEVGRVLNMPAIGRAAATARFKIDIDKRRTAAIRRANGGGRLPIGEASAHVTEASYKFVSTHNLDLTVTSNGAVANGTVDAPGKFVDLSCNFTFDNTDNLNKMKIRPRMKIHRKRKTQ